MIIKDKQKKSLVPKVLKSLLGIGVIGALLFYGLSKLNKTVMGNGYELFCDMEHTTDGQFKSGGNLFSNAITQSSDKSRSGKYSSLINKKHKYGAGYLIKDIATGDQICIDIWRLSPIADYGFLAAKGNAGSDFMMQTKIAEETDEKGFDRLNICFDVPDDDALSEIKVFPYSLDENGHAYFDDLKITITKAEEIQALIKSLDVPKVKLYIDTKGWNELEAARADARRYGILVNNRGYVNARMTTNEKSQKVDLRLKGDWHDHLEGMKWSFRLKTAKDESWERMQTFSIQSPERRFFAKEWLFHDFLSKQDVLSPKYDFFWLTLNDLNPMVYAYEEHFDKHLPESQNRREGVILKLTEDAAWEQRLRSKKALGHHNGHLVEAKFHSDVAPFKASRVESDSVMLRQFTEGQELLYAYKHYLKPVDQLFDIDRMAKYYASLEVLNAYHSLVWHNQRFYYNPVTRLLEPIAYDGYIEESEYNINTYVCFAYYKSYKSVTPWSRYYNAFFRNEAFAKKFAYYLHQFSAPGYMKDYLKEIDTPLAQRERLIKINFPKYSLNKKAILAKSKEIHASLPCYDNISIKAYIDDITTDSIHLSVSNYNHLPLEIIGSGEAATNEFSTSMTRSKVIWSNHPKMAPEYVDFSIPKNHNYLYYRVLGLEQVFHSKINRWSSGNGIVKRKDLVRKTQIPFEARDISLSEGEVQIKAGKYQLSTPLVLPEGQRLIVAAGTEIDLINGAYIFASGGIEMKGTPNQMIKIHSSDHSGQGLMNIKAKEKSVLSHVIFEHLDNIDEGNWTMPGAVTFYESTVELYNCQFKKNHCEDALNIVRSDFTIDKMHLSDTYADGFDADFSAGKITNSIAINTGNDGFDFSGSIITIDNCTFNKIGDKAISAGEKATIDIENVSINKAEIGIASKDLSEVNIKNIDIVNCNKAFAAYQKKPEYGPAKITIENYTAKDNKFLELAENGSKISFPNK